MQELTQALSRLDAVIASRKPANGGDPQTSYVARLLHRGPDAFLKKIGEEATEVVMAAKDVEAAVARGDSALLQTALQAKFVGEVADLWFHSMVALAHHGLSSADVIEALMAREGLSGLQERAQRKEGQQ